MSLTGNIEIFPLQEVLRLLARSSKNGCLRVESGSVHGRIYLDHGALTLATVHTDSEIIEQLDASGLVDSSVHRMDANALQLPDHLTDGRDHADLTDFVREHVVESLYRMRKPGVGNFEFHVDATSRFGTGQSFDAEVAVAEADRRASEWADIEETIDDMHRAVRMVRELDQSEVTVNSATWRVLASLDGGASVTDISRHLGMTLFRSAREIAGLMRADLVEFAPADAPRSIPERRPVDDVADEPATDDWAGAEAHDEEHEAPAPWDTPDSESASDWQSPGWDDEPSETPADDDLDAFFNNAVAADAEDDQDAGDDADTGADQPAAEESTSDRGWWADAMGTEEAADSDADADAFLESVFSQLDGDTGGSDEAEEEEETGFSMGLLRRRRMGPVSKDITEGH